MSHERWARSPDVICRIKFFILKFVCAIERDSKRRFTNSFILKSVISLEICITKNKKLTADILE